MKSVTFVMKFVTWCIQVSCASVWGLNNVHKRAVETE
jgi:hypothetical protein